MKTQLLLDFEKKTKRIRKKEYRYRADVGSTHRALKCVDRHLHKVGAPKYAKGYIYRNRKGQIRVRVLVRGTLGTARFDGFCWGYSGTGPRGLIDLLVRLGVSKGQAEETAFRTPIGMDEKNGEYWRIEWTTTLRRAA